jgi:hypothetical protein
LGSTEPHYTPSKVYQAVLSEKPIFAVLHQESTAVEVIGVSHSGLVLSFDGIKDIGKMENDFFDQWKRYRQFAASFSAGKVDHSFFELYSAKHITEYLVNIINEL